ncbi:MAG TPA: BON domain-containing protein [Blastocatellia bacterium]|nr:BON domain-containing protein [Blastocatellia bacterium]
MTTNQFLKKILASTMTLTMLAMLAVTPILAAPGSHTAEPKAAETIKQIRKELVTLPFYGVFDNLAYSYEDGVVTLTGQVVRPTTRSDAARRVERLAGVDQVINKIEVLPLSNFDDQIRLATYRAIYRQPGLDRLAFQAVPPIHIIVSRGHVTLEGVVPNKGDSIRAYIAARGVPNAFSVTNNLRVENAK